MYTSLSAFMLPMSLSTFMLHTLLLLSTLVSGARVLVWQDVASRSHFIGIKPLVEELAMRGHEIVFVSAYFDDHLNKTVDLVHVGHQDDKVDSKAIFEGTKEFSVMQYRDYVLTGQRASLRHPRVRALLQEEKQKFDVVLLSFMSMNVGLYAAKHIFRAPTIAFCATRYQLHLEQSMGNPLTPSYVPVTSLSLRSKMNFWERVQNTIATIGLSALHKYVLVPSIYEELRQELQLESVPDIYSDIYDLDMVFYNTHPILDSVKPVSPNTILVGGMHVKPANLSRIPKDVKEWMDGAEHGVILVSFGSILSSHELPADKLSAMLRVFGELRERVLWKWESDHMDNQPDNVLIRKWLPQSDILGHPNLNLFVTHGGLLGLQEALYNGIPMVAMPAFADQFGNADLIVRLGLGASLAWPDFSEPNFRSAVHKVLDDHIILGRTKEYGDSLRDELQTPLARAVWNVEYVIRHRDLKHLKPSSIELNLFQYLLLDVFIFLFAIIIIILALFRACCTCLCRRRGLKSAKSKKE